MQTLKDFQNEVFVITDYKSFKVESMTYEEYLNDYWSDDTTSPRGVENRLHIREKLENVYQEIGEKETISESEFDDLDADDQDNYKWAGEDVTAYELWSWGPNGQHPSFLESFETEEEAYVRILESKEYDYQNKSTNTPSCEFSKDEVIESLASLHCIDKNTVISILHHLDLIDKRKLELKEIAEVKYENYKIDLLNTLESRIIEVLSKIKDNISIQDIELRLSGDKSTNEICNKIVGYVGYEYAKSLGWTNVLKAIHENLTK